MIRLLIKGNQDQAIEALSKRNITATFVTCHSDRCFYDTSEDNRVKVIEWYLEEKLIPSTFEPGMLLFHT